MTNMVIQVSHIVLNINLDTLQVFCHLSEKKKLYHSIETYVSLTYISEVISTVKKSLMQKKEVHF